MVFLLLKSAEREQMLVNIIIAYFVTGVGGHLLGRHVYAMLIKAPASPTTHHQ